MRRRPGRARPAGRGDADLHRSRRPWSSSVGWAGWTPLPMSVRDAYRARRRPARAAGRDARRRLPGPPVRDRAALASGLSSSGTATWWPSTRSRSTLRAGEVAALMGRNGSGKSSLLWALQGTGARTSGRVTVDRPATPATCAPGARRRRGRPGAADPRRPALPADRGRGVRAGRPGDRLGPGHLPRAARPDRARRAATSIHPRDLSEGQRLALVLGDPAQRAARRCCCSTSRPAAWTTRPRRPSRACCASWPAQGTAVLLSTHDVEFVAEVGRPGAGAGHRRGGRRRPHGRGRGVVPGVRSPGGQGPRRRLADASTR